MAVRGGGLNWELTIREGAALTTINSWTHNIDRFCAMQEIIIPGVLIPGTDAWIFMRAGTGLGQIKISDVVLFFTVTV
jgi:hypothetical protein